MQRLNTLVLIVMCFGVSGFAQPFGDTEAQISAFIFNAQWEEADSLIELNIKADPENPHYYYFKLPLYYYSRYYNNGALDNDSLMQLVQKYALKTIELAEAAPESPLNNFYLGSAYDYLSRYNIRYQGNWDAYWSARSAVSYLEDAVDEDPSLVDAYMGLAVIEYFTAVQIQGFMRSVAWLVGMLGDRETALDYMRNVAENGKICKNEAQFALASLYRFFENDFAASNQILASMRKKFPRNTFIENTYHQTRLMQIVNTEGVAALTNDPPDSIAARYQITNAGVLNLLGYSLINSNRHDDAIEVFLLNIKLYPDLANPYDSIAECYQLMGNDQKAVEYSRIGLEKLDIDETINDQFRETLREILENRIEELSPEVST